MRNTESARVRSGRQLDATGCVAGRAGTARVDTKHVCVCFYLLSTRCIRKPTHYEARTNGEETEARAREKRSHAKIELWKANGKKSKGSTTAKEEHGAEQWHWWVCGTERLVTKEQRRQAQQHVDHNLPAA